MRRNPPKQSQQHAPPLPSKLIAKGKISNLSFSFCTDTQTDVLAGFPASATCVQRFDDSRVLQIALLIAVCYVLHRCGSLDIPRHGLYNVKLKFLSLKILWLLFPTLDSTLSLPSIQIYTGAEPKLTPHTCSPSIVSLLRGVSMFTKVEPDLHRGRTEVHAEPMLPDPSSREVTTLTHSKTPAIPRRFWRGQLQATVTEDKLECQSPPKWDGPHLNDPSAGSPTETLLRLLLPLNDKVRLSSPSRRSETLFPLRSQSLTGPLNR